MKNQVQVIMRGHITYPSEQAISMSVNYDETFEGAVVRLFQLCKESGLPVQFRSRYGNYTIMEGMNISDIIRQFKRKMALNCSRISAKEQSDILRNLKIMAAKQELVELSFAQGIIIYRHEDYEIEDRNDGHLRITFPDIKEKMKNGATKHAYMFTFEENYDLRKRLNNGETSYEPKEVVDEICDIVDEYRGIKQRTQNFYNNVIVNQLAKRM